MRVIYCVVMSVEVRREICAKKKENTGFELLN